MGLIGPVSAGQIAAVNTAAAAARSPGDGCWARAMVTAGLLGGVTYKGTRVVSWPGSTPPSLTLSPPLDADTGVNGDVLAVTIVDKGW